MVLKAGWIGWNGYLWVGRGKEHLPVLKNNTVFDISDLGTYVETLLHRTKKKVNITSMEVLLAEKLRIEKKKVEFMEKITKKKEAMYLVDDDSVESYQAKKNELDQMIVTEWKKLKEQQDEVEDILDCWKNRDQPLFDFLREAIAKKEEDLRCPVCLEVEIFSTCERQHIICDCCLTKLDKLECPECRVKLPETPRRDRFGEKMAGEYKDFLQRRDNIIELGRYKDHQVTKL